MPDERAEQLERESLERERGGVVGYGELAQQATAERRDTRCSPPRRVREQICGRRSECREPLRLGHDEEHACAIGAGTTVVRRTWWKHERTRRSVRVDREPPPRSELQLERAAHQQRDRGRGMHV